MHGQLILLNNTKKIRSYLELNQNKTKLNQSKLTEGQKNDRIQIHDDYQLKIAGQYKSK